MCSETQPHLQLECPFAQRYSVHLRGFIVSTSRLLALAGGLQSPFIKAQAKYNDEIGDSLPVDIHAHCFPVMSC